MVGVAGKGPPAKINGLGCQTQQNRTIERKGVSAGLSNPKTRRRGRDPDQLDLFAPPNEYPPGPPAEGTCHLGVNDRLGAGRGQRKAENEDTPPARPNNAGPAAWFGAVRVDRRLTMAAVSVARLMQDGRPRSLVEYADQTGLSLRAIPAAVRRLEAAGHIRVIRSRGGPGRKNRFVLVHKGGVQ